MHARSGQLQGIFGFLRPLIHVRILVWSWSVDKNDGVFARKHHRVPPMPKRTHQTKKIAVQPKQVGYLLKSRSQWPPTHSPFPLRRSVTVRTCRESLSRKSSPHQVRQFRSTFTYDVCNVFDLLLPRHCRTHTLASIPHQIQTYIVTLFKALYNSHVHIATSARTACTRYLIRIKFLHYLYGIVQFTCTHSNTSIFQRGSWYASNSSIHPHRVHIHGLLMPVVASWEDTVVQGDPNQVKGLCEALVQSYVDGFQSAFSHFATWLGDLIEHIKCLGACTLTWVSTLTSFVLI